MQDIVLELVKKVKDFYKDYEDFDGLDSFEEFVEKARKNGLFDKYFSFIKPYLDNPEILDYINSNTITSEEDLVNTILTISFLFPKSFFYELIKKCHDKIDDFLNYIIIDTKEDIDILLSLGYTDKEIISAEGYMVPESITKSIVESSTDPTLVKYLLDNEIEKCTFLVVEELKKGNTGILKKYNSSYHSEQHIKKLLSSLIEEDISNIDEIIDKIILRFSDGSKISVIKDKSFALKLIEKYGSKAIVFIDNPDEEIVSKITDFSIEDYIRVEGTYRDSMPLLKYFINKGDYDVLSYTSPKAITDEIIELLASKEVDLSKYTGDRFSPGPLSKSLSYNKYLVSQGKYTYIKNLENIYTNLEEFNFVYECQKTNPSRIIESNIISYLLGNKEEPKRLPNETISKEVAERIVELGFKLEDYILFNGYSEELLKTYYALGDKRALFFMCNLKAEDVEQITYEDFINLLSIKSDVEIQKATALKLIKEGHYDVLSHINNYTLKSITKELGLDEISDEEYYSLPKELQEIEHLKDKHILPTIEEVRERLISDISQENVTLAARVNMSYEELKSIIDKYQSYYPSVMSKEVLLKYLKEGHTDALKYATTYFYDSSELVEITDLYYELVSGKLPDPKEFSDYSYNVEKALFTTYIKHKRYEIATLNSRHIHIDENDLQILKDNNYSLEDFLEHPILDGEVVLQIINEDNIDIIAEKVSSLDEKISRGNNLLLHLYKSSIPKEKIIKIAKLCSIDVKDLLLNISKEEMDIIELINIEEALKDHKIISLIIDNLDPEQVESLLQSKVYMFDNTKRSVIDGMVSKGHYQFVKYYDYSGNEKLLKKAIVGGYIPSPTNIERSSFLSKAITNINFAEDEHEILKEHLKTNPRYIIYCLEDYKDDKDFIVEKLLEEPDIIELLPVEYKEDIELLEQLVIKSPYIVSKFYRGLSPEDKTRLIIANPEIIEYINTYDLDSKTLQVAAEKYPKVIDLLSYPDTNVIEIAFNNGYKLNQDSSSYIIRYALNNDKEIPIDIWNIDNIEKILVALTNNTYESKKDILLPIFDKVYSESKASFVAILPTYNSTISYTNLIELFERYGYTEDDFYQVNGQQDKDKILFILNLKELDKLPEEEQLKKITEYLETSDYKEECFNWLQKHNKDSFIKSYAKANYIKEPLLFVKYLDQEDIDEEIISITKKLILEDPKKYYSLHNYINEVLDSKEIVLKILEYDSYVFYKISDELKLDYEVARLYALLGPSNISSISPDTEKYEDICIEAITKDGRAYQSLPFLSTSIKALEIAIKTYPNAIIYADSSIITKELLSNIPDLSAINLESLDIEVIKKIIELDSIDLNNKALLIRLLDIVATHTDEIVLTEKTTNIIIKLLEEDPNLVYKKYFNLYSIIDDKDLTEEQLKERENANNLLDAYGKVNTIKQNPVFSYELVKYIYPSIGTENTVNLMKYNSGANTELIQLIQEGKQELVLSYLELIKKYHIFPNDDKQIHFAFRYFSKYKDLIENIIDKELTSEEVINLTKVITNRNLYHISTREELTHYDEVVDKYAKDMLVSTDVSELKDFLAHTFGHPSIESLKTFFTTHRLDNFAQIYHIIKEIEKNLDSEKANDLRFNKAELKVILLMKEIIETDNVEELHRLIQANLDKENNIFDYSDIVNDITLKVRRIYNTEFNIRLSKVDKLESKRTREVATITDKDGNLKEVEYELIDMNEEPFHFLVHRIYHYDAKMNSLYEMLMKDPSLWTKLDGASTLSTSSISDKGFWMLNSTDTSGIILIFDELPDDFMLFMYGRDLYVEHGGHKLEPTASSNCYMDIDSLNQSTAVNHHSSYNEVAGFRKGVMPKAILCNGPHPTEAQVRVATYFNIPIIRMDMRKYEEITRKRYEEAKKRLKEQSTIDDIFNVIYNGQRGISLQSQIDYCIECIRDSYKSQKIDYKEMLSQLVRLRTLVNRVIENDDKHHLRKIELLIQTIAIEKKLTDEDIIDIEEANMGESGIMYKEHTEDKTYLLKPAVDKQNLRNQGFRAEIQKAASILQKIISPDTAVEVEVVGDKKLRVSKQEKIELSSDQNLLDRWATMGGELDPKYKRQLLQEYIVDFLLCNYDCFSGNFIIDSNDNIRGVDKEQSFRFLDEEGSLEPDFSYVPNGNGRTPIYKLLFERYQRGEIDLDFTIFDEKIKIVEEISDEEYKEIFRPYVESLDNANSEKLLDKIVKRKELGIAIMKEYINRIRKDEVKEGDVL